MQGKELNVNLRINFVGISFSPTGVCLKRSRRSSPTFPARRRDNVKLSLKVNKFCSRPGFCINFSKRRLASPAMRFKARRDNAAGRFGISPVLCFAKKCGVRAHGPLISVRPSLLLRDGLASMELSVANHMLCAFGREMFINKLACSPKISIAVDLKTAVHKMAMKCTCRTCASGVKVKGKDRSLMMDCTVSVGLFGGDGGGRGDVQVLWL